MNITTTAFLCNLRQDIKLYKANVTKLFEVILKIIPIFFILVYAVQIHLSNEK